MDIRDAQPRLTPDQRSDLAKKLLEEVAAAAAGTADGIPKSHYRFDQHPMCLNLARGAVMLGSDDPYFRLHEGTARDTTRIGGREYINFSNYNYLGLSGHPALNKAVIEAIERYGTSVSASRMVGGERPIQGTRSRAGGVARHGRRAGDGERLRYQRHRDRASLRAQGSDLA